MSINPGSTSSADAILRSADLLPRMRKRWHAYEVYLSALVIFAASRAVVVAGVNLGMRRVRAADIVRTLDPAILQADNI